MKKVRGQIFQFKVPTGAWEDPAQEVDLKKTVATRECGQTTHAGGQCRRLTTYGMSVCSEHLRIEAGLVAKQSRQPNVPIGTLGLFSVDDKPPNRRLGVQYGYELPMAVAVTWYGDANVRAPYVTLGYDMRNGGNTPFLVDAVLQRGPAALLQHSDDPNCQLLIFKWAHADPAISDSPRSIIRTLRPIAAGEELTVRYPNYLGAPGTSFWPLDERVEELRIYRGYIPANTRQYRPRRNQYGYQPGPNGGPNGPGPNIPLLRNEEEQEPYPGTGGEPDDIPYNAGSQELDLDAAMAGIDMAAVDAHMRELGAAQPIALAGVANNPPLSMDQLLRDIGNLPFDGNKDDDDAMDFVYGLQRDQIQAAAPASAPPTARLTPSGAARAALARAAAQPPMRTPAEEERYQRNVAKFAASRKRTQEAVAGSSREARAAEQRAEHERLGPIMPEPVSAAASQAQAPKRQRKPSQKVLERIAVEQNQAKAKRKLTKEAAAELNKELAELKNKILQRRQPVENELNEATAAWRAAVHPKSKSAWNSRRLQKEAELDEIDEAFAATYDRVHEINDLLEPRKKALTLQQKKGLNNLRKLF